MSTLLRKFIASASAMAILSTLLVSTVFAGSFNDVSEGDIWYDAVEQGVSDGYITVPTGGDFNPYDVGTRAIMADASVNAGGFTQITPATPTFDDVPTTHWAYSQIETGVANGLWQGYGDGNFGPDDALTRAQAAIILVNVNQPMDPPSDYMSATEIFSDVPGDHYGADAIRTAYYWSYINGYDTGDFGPDDTLVKYQIAIMHNNALYHAEARPDTVMVISGDITITGGPDMPLGMTIPPGGTSINFMEFTITAGSDGAVVDGMTFARQGVGAAGDFDNVYLYDDNFKLTSGRSVNSDENTAEFASLDWVFAPFESRTFQLRADISTTASAADEHRFYIYDVEGTDVGGEVNLAGPYMTIGGTAAGTVDVEKNGTIANPTLGEKGARISQFKLTMDGEDGIVKWLNVYLTGTISLSEIGNFKLYKGSSVNEANLIAVQSDVSSRDTVNFDLTGMTGGGLNMDDGDDQTFTMTADLDADSGDTVTTYFEEDTDTFAIGEVFQTGLQVNRTFTSGDSHSVTLQGGEITLSFAGPSAQDIPIDTKKATFLDFILSTDRDIEVKQLVVIVSDQDSVQTGAGDCGDVASAIGDLIDTISTEANYKNIRIMEGDKNLMETEDLAVGGNDCAQTLTFTDSFFMDGGDSAGISVKMDTDDSAQTDQVKVELSAVSTTAGIKDIATNKFIDDIVPSSAIVGNTMTLVASSLTVTLASTPVSDTFVKGTLNVPVLGLLFKTGPAEGIYTTGVTFTGYIDGAGDGGPVAVATNEGTTLKDTINNMRLYEDGYASDKSPLAGPEAIEDDATIVFNDMEYTIPASTTRRVVLVGDVSTNAFADSDAETFYFDITAGAQITAEDADGDSLTPTAAAPNTGGSILITTADTGTLTVKTKESATPSSNIVIAGRTGVELARFEFDATTEDITVNDITLGYIAGTPTDGGTDEVVSISVYDADDLTTPLSTDFVNGGVVDLDDIGFVVPADDSAVLVVTVDLNSIQQNADSGTVISIFLQSIEEAQGAAGEDLTGLVLDTNVSATGCAGNLDVLGGAGGDWDATETVMTLSAACASIAVGDVLEVTTTAGTDRVLVLDKDANDDATETDYTVIRGAGSAAALDHSGAADVAVSTGIDILKAQGNYMVVRETKPTFATVAYNSSKQLESGSQIGIYKFTVDAEAEEDVSLGRLAFKVTGTIGGVAVGFDVDGVDGGDDEPSLVNGVATDGSDGLATYVATAAPTVVLTGLTLYDVTDGEEVENVTVYYGNMEITSEAYLVLDFGTEEEVGSAGKTYELRADVTGVDTNGDFLSVSISDADGGVAINKRKKVETGTLANLRDTTLTDAESPVGGVLDNVVWSDQSDVTNDPSQDYTNGYLLKSLKTDSQTLNYQSS